MKHFFPKTFLLVWLIPLAFALHPNCGGESNLQGGAEAGNPPVATRTVTGSVPKTQTSLVARADVIIPTFSCVADEVVATDSVGEATTENMDTDCTFSIELIVGEVYSFGFALKGSQVATMAFSHSSETLPTSVLAIGAGDAPLDFGRITIEGSSGYSETEPSTVNDLDEDGIVDYDDEDDNNNGIPDTHEEDCDLDGFWDVYDADTAGCTEDETANGEVEEDDPEETTGDSETTGGETTGTTGETTGGGTTGGETGGGTTGGETTTGSTGTTTGGATGTTGGGGETIHLTPNRIYEVDPRNGTTDVELSREVRARAGCEIDRATLTSSTFRVIDDSAREIHCRYDVTDSNHTAKCDHDDNPFSLGTTYYGIIRDLKCIDGSTIETTRWTWKTVTSQRRETRD